MWLTSPTVRSFETGRPVGGGLRPPHYRRLWSAHSGLGVLARDDSLVRPFHRQHAPRKFAIIELEAWSGQRSGCHCRPNIHELPFCSTASASPSRERQEIRKERGRTLTP